MGRMGWREEDEMVWIGAGRDVANSLDHHDHGDEVDYVG